MRLLTTLRFGLLVTLPAAGTPFFLSACGGEEAACTTIGCESTPGPMSTDGMGGSGGGSGSFIDPNEAPQSAAAGSGSLMGEACQQVTFSSQASAVNVLILLDRSTSMLELADRTVPGVTRWDAVTSGLRAFVNSAEAADARIGLQFFGLQNGNDDCSVPKYTIPAVPVAPLAQNRAALLAAIDATRPGSLTPTAPAVAGALEYALQVAELPENAEVPTVMILASDGIPSECGPTDPASGLMVVSFREIIDTLKRYSVPPQDALGNPMRPSVRTYIVGTEELENNADALADAGGGEAFLVGGGATGGADLEARFLDALLSIVVKPLSCIIDVPQTAPDGAPVDFEKVRMRYTGSSSGLTTEFPRASGPGACGVDRAWFYEPASPPQKIFFCRAACDSLGAGDLQLELGCSPQMILR